MDLTTVDHLLSTTRSVRKRLDFSRPVDASVITKCIDLALQAPTGGNSQGWSFIVVTDANKRKAVSEIYKKAFKLYSSDPAMRARYDADANDLRAQQMDRVLSSADFLADHMHEAPALVIACIEGRIEKASPVEQAGVYGSILPAAWSFMLALRSRGLGTAWTTLHIMYEQEVAKILGIPASVTQAALFPVAYFTGEDFKPAKRLPTAAFVHWDSWDNKRS
jgi:nitroreductase